MKRINKFLALLICAVMIFSIIPVQGFASETETADTSALIQPEVEPAAASDAVMVEHNGETTYYADLHSAFNGFAPSNNTYGGKYVITLLSDVSGMTAVKNLQYPTEILDITLDLNGHTITGNGTNIAVNINLGSNVSGVSSGSFTIKDSVGTGVITGGKGGVYVYGKNATLYFQGGTITGNHGASKGGGIMVGATTMLVMTGGVITGNSVKGTSSANTGYGGGVLANYGSITGGAIYGNVAYKGSHLQTGRGGGVATEITRTSGYSTLTIANGVVYGNTAENAGDDVMAQGNGNVKFSLSIGTENWYIDGWNGTKAGSGGGQTDRYNAENPVAYTDGGFTDVKNKTVGLKYVAPAEPEKPAAPEAPHSENTNAVVIFECMTNGEITSHGAASMGFTLDEKYCTVGEVYENADGKWACDVTVDLQKYYDEMVGYADEEAGLPHRLTNDVEINTRVMTAIWDEEEALWIFDTVTFETTCEPAAPEAPDHADDFFGAQNEWPFTICCVDLSYAINSYYFNDTYAAAGEVYEENGEYFVDITWNVKGYWECVKPITFDNIDGCGVHTTIGEFPEALVRTAKWDAEQEKWEYQGETINYYVTCKVPTVAKLESTGEEFETLQAAIDAASALMVDADHENQTITLLDDIKESVKISWATGTKTANNFNLTIDLNGHTVTGNGGSVFDIARLGSGAASKVMTVTFNDSVGTGVVTGGNNTYGGAVYNSTAKGKINIVVNGGTWTGNAATSSGGAISSCYTTSTQVTINGGTFTGNTAGSNGGAIYARNLYITGGEITGNSANSGGGVYVFTAASTILDMTGGKIYGNTATTDGDDIIWRANKGNTSTAYLKLLDAATMGVENVGGWYLDASGARYSEDNAVEFENYAKYTTLNSRIALKAAEKILVAPEAPDKYGNNVTPELINVICDSDKNHEPMTIKWQHQSTKVRDWVSGVVWSDEYNTWIVPIRIDSISTYYVWMHFEEAYNDISHDLVPDAPLPEGEYHIDTYLKWDEEKQLWVTLDEKPIDVHVCCKTTPDVPSAAAMSRRGFQIQVKGDMDGDGIFGENGLENDGVWELFATTIPAEYYEDMVVYGSREEGFFIDVTVTLEDGDIFISNWIEKRAPGQKYSYNWEMTQKTITFTLAYDGSLTGTLYGDDASYWVLASNGEIFGKVGEAFVRPSMPEAPKQANVTDKLVAVICDSDGDRHETVYGKWYPLGHCETTSDIVWDNELGAWTVDVQIGSLYIMYVDQLEDANNGIVHELVEDITCVDTKLVWNTEEELWYPVEAVELHTTCRTAPLAPVHNQLASYQVKVYGDVNGEEKAYTTYIPEGAYTVSEVYGSREEGFFVDVTFALEEDDIYQQNWLANRYPGGSYEYDWSKTPKTVTYTLKYNGSLTGTLYGNRHAVNTNYDWVLLTNGKHFGVVAEAYLVPMQFVLTLNPNGGQVDPETVTVTFGKAIGTLPVPTRTGYTFAGWFDAEGKEVTAETVYTIGGDSTVTAKWTANEYTLTLDANKGEVDPATVTVTFDAAIGTLPVPTRTGYTFAGWFDAEGKEVTAETVYTIDGDSTVTAKWTANEYTLTLDANKGEVDPATVTVTYDAAVGTLPVPTRTGYTFAGWFDAQGNQVTAETVYTIDGDSTVTAKWTANEYTVTLDANKGEVDPATVTVTFDAPVGTLPVPTRTGYTFAGWFDAQGNQVTAETVYTVADDATLTAQWTANAYNLTLDANGGAFMMTMTEDAEVITTLTITVVYDQPVGELPVPERAGYTFNGWFDEEGNEVTADTVYTTAGDMTVTAKWTANKYTITLNPNYGKVDPKSLEATYDEAIGKLPKPTREGFFFTFWRTEDGTMVTEETIYNFAGDITLYAEWRTASPADSPATGDGMILFAFVTMLISAGALLFLMERKRRVQA